MPLDDILTEAEDKNEQLFLSGEIPQDWVMPEEKKQEQWIKVSLNHVHVCIRYLKSFQPNNAQKLKLYQKYLLNLHTKYREFRLNRAKRWLLQTNLKLMAITANEQKQEARFNRLLSIQRHLEKHINLSTVLLAKNTVHRQ
ncbi:MAG: hypothetical protein ACI4QM_03600, partial [Alphaproteobacteria bacterium]